MGIRQKSHGVSRGFARSETGGPNRNVLRWGRCFASLTFRSRWWVAVVDGGQFLELGKRAQGRGLGLTRAATAGRQGQGGQCYSGGGDQLNELLHRRYVMLGLGGNLRGGSPHLKVKIKPGVTNPWPRACV